MGDHFDALAHVETLTVELGEAQDALAKVRVDLEEAQEDAKELREEKARVEGLLDEAESERDHLSDQVDRQGTWVDEVLATAERLHERHRRLTRADFRFCADETCTAWNDLARERGWRT